MRLRLVSVQVAPTFVVEDDDGNLSPAPPLDSVTVPAARLAEVPALVLDGIATLESSLFAKDD